MAKKPAPKPVRKPAPKAPVLRRPSANPLDAVRNPNFEAAMAQQDYFNNLSRLVAERNARGPEYNLMPIGGTGISAEQMQGLTPDRRQALEQAMLATEQQRNLPNLMPIGGTGISAEQIQNLTPDRRQALEQAMAMRQGIPSGQIANQNPSIGQMQDYNRMLQQGMQNSNTLNQGAMANFANMQPGMQAPQQAGATTPNPAMPVAGMGMQQPKQTSLPRKLSTFSNTPARFV